jgi:hypothetical protein
VKTTSRSNTPNPIPQPYLALAPSPLHYITAPVTHQNPAPSRTPLVLPSTWRRTEEAERAKTPKPPSKPRKGYAAGLLAPPTVVPGGQAATPRVLATGESSGIVPVVIRRTSREQLRPRPGEEGLRPLRGNASVLSLGQLGQIMEADPVVETPENTPQRRRRRIVRGEDGGTVARRLTVTSREEGRALGLARGASMRRLNVWDGESCLTIHYYRTNGGNADLPETTDAPPAFPFPTPSTARNPPTFDSPAAPAYFPQDSPTPATAALPISLGRPLSPPPTWDQAMGHSPLPHTPLDLPTITPTHSARPSISITTSALVTTNVSSPPSPASTHYVSAPQSPDSGHLSQDSSTGLTADEREDRKAWNADLLAGYSLEERVRREGLRRTARDEKRKDGDHNARADADESFEDAEDGSQPIAPAVEGITPEASAAEDEDSLPVVTRTDAVVAEAVGAELPTPLETLDSSTKEAAAPLSERKTETTPAQNGSGSSDVHAERFDSTSGGGSEPGVISRDTADAMLPTEGVIKASVDGSRTILVKPDTAIPASVVAEPKPSAPAVDPVPKSVPISDVMAGIVNQLNTSKDSQLPPSSSVGASDPASAVSPSRGSLHRTPTRGHVVRHSTSSIGQSPYARHGSIRSKRESTLAPLFSSAGYNLGPRISPALDSGKQVESSPDISQVGFAHRQSEPVIGVTAVSDKVGAPLSKTVSLSHGQPEDIKSEASSSSRLTEKTLPPHREAALKRRELALRRHDPAPSRIRAPSPKHTHSRTKSGPLPSSGPLIDFNDFSFAPIEPLASSLVFPGLQRSAFSSDLLGLFGEPGGVAESSKQGAEKAALVQDIEAARIGSESPGRERDAERSTRMPVVDMAVSSDVAKKGKAPSIRSIASTSSKRRVPPPPPHSLRPKITAPVEAVNQPPVVSPSRSVLSTATSPITPRPHPAAIPIDTSPTPKPRTQSIPTRRPPPPPLRSNSDTRSITSIDPPPLPPRPHGGPPEFAFRPAHLRHESNISIQTSSSISLTEKDHISKPPTSPWRHQKRLSMTAKPRGPRPPPPPPRPWAKVLASEEYTITRPVEERSISDGLILSSDVRDNGKISPTRSTSVGNVRSGITRETSLEYTDLDVIMARLEGTGREYEVC